MANEGEGSAYYSRQANDSRYGGFCGRCGEGVRPLLNGDIEAFGKCEYNGNHPDCGGHRMVFVEKIPHTFGSYEIYECRNSNCDYKESM